ncbi:MAG: ABC transporter permease, partial [Chloroflexota bacterium]
MTQYIVRRIIQALPLLFLISVAIFLMLQLIPGGPLAAYESNPNISPEDILRLEEELGLRDPVHVKYIKWLGNVLQGDWGYSLVTRRPVLVEIGDRLPNTLYLAVIAFAISLLVAVPMGVISAVKQYSVLDHVITTIAFMGQSIPIFWFGLILIIIFNVMLQNPYTGEPLFPGGGMYTIGEPFFILDRIHHLILPVAMLSLFQLAQHTRYMRSGMLDVLHQDYIRTARAKGLKERLVISRHAFKNAALPLVTITMLEMPGLFNGAVFTETIFSWPGMGRLFFNSAERVDYAVLMAIIMLNATLIVFFNLVADIVYAYLDP